MINGLNGKTIFKEKIKIILASSSPRRKELFRQTGISFQTMTLDTEPEPFYDEDPETYVVRSAKAKAEPVALLHPDACVISADTIMVYNGGLSCKIIGKPKNIDDSLKILRSFQGGQHQVFTACCIIWPQIYSKEMCKYEVWIDKAELFFGHWPDEALRTYIQTGEPQDKAGSFSIEGIGGFLVERIEGNYMTILGLPLSALLRRLIQGDAVYVVS